MTLFKLALKQCIDKGLVSGKRQAIDNVFVKAKAAMASMVEREILEDAAIYSKELESNKDEEDHSEGELHQTNRLRINQLKGRTKIQKPAII